MKIGTRLAQAFTYTILGSFFVPLVSALCLIPVLACLVFVSDSLVGNVPFDGVGLFSLVWSLGVFVFALGGAVMRPCQQMSFDALFVQFFREIFFGIACAIAFFTVWGAILDLDFKHLGAGVILGCLIGEILGLLVGAARGVSHREREA